MAVPNTHITSGPTALGELSVSECKSLLLRTPVGRIGFSYAGEQNILPVNYRLMDETIVFRTSAGRKLHAIASDQKIAFEVDQWDRQDRTGWSVLVVGEAEEIEDHIGFEEAENLGLRPWAESPEQNRWVRIVPTKITGRRIT